MTTTTTIIIPIVQPLFIAVKTTAGGLFRSGCCERQMSTSQHKCKMIVSADSIVDWDRFEASDRMFHDNDWATCFQHWNITGHQILYRKRGNNAENSSYGDGAVITKGLIVLKQHVVDVLGDHHIKESVTSVA